MLLQATDYQFARLSQSLAGVWQLLGDWETRWARRRLAGVQLDRPVFLTGLARSGTTILLEEQVATLIILWVKVVALGVDVDERTQKLLCRREVVDGVGKGHLGEPIRKQLQRLKAISDSQ